MAEPLDYFDRARTQTVTPNVAELEWEATSASKWMHENNVSLSMEMLKR